MKEWEFILETIKKIIIIIIRKIFLSNLHKVNNARLNINYNKYYVLIIIQFSQSNVLIKVSFPIQKYLCLNVNFR